MTSLWGQILRWNGHCTAAALSCIQWKAHHEFHVPHVIIEYLQLQQNNPSRIDDILTLNNIVILQHSMFFLVTNWLQNRMRLRCLVWRRYTRELFLWPCWSERESGALNVNKFQANYWGRKLKQGQGVHLAITLVLQHGIMRFLSIF